MGKILLLAGLACFTLALVELATGQLTSWYLLLVGTASIGLAVWIE